MRWPQVNNGEFRGKLVVKKVLAGLLATALTGCGMSNNEQTSYATIEPQPSMSQSIEPSLTPTAAPSASETLVESSMTLEEARDALDKFAPQANPGLYDFSRSIGTDNEATARKAAEDYLEQKQYSRLTLVDFTGLSTDELMALRDEVTERIDSVTQGTFQVGVEIVPASDVAIQLYDEQTRNHNPSKEKYKDYASVIAQVTMPGTIDYNNGAVIALTENGFNGDSATLSSGKYADIAGADSTVSIHEWAHAVSQLGHAMVATPNGLDSLGDPGISLEAFLSNKATINPYSEIEIMGNVSNNPAVDPEKLTLSRSALYLTEAAERMLGEPTAINAALLSSAGQRVEYSEKTFDANTDIVIIPLKPVLTLNETILEGGDSTINRIALEPVLIEAENELSYWQIRMVALTDSNATIELSYLYVSALEHTTTFIQLTQSQRLVVAQAPDGGLAIAIE